MELAKSCRHCATSPLMTRYAALGPGIWHAYRNSDRHLLGMTWRDRLYVDNTSDCPQTFHISGRCPGMGVNPLLSHPYSSECSDKVACINDVGNYWTFVHGNSHNAPWLLLTTFCPQNFFYMYGFIWPRPLQLDNLNSGSRPPPKFISVTP